MNIPKYLQDCEDDLVGVSYNNMQKCDIKHEIVSKDFTPAVEYKRQYRKSEELGKKSNFVHKKENTRKNRSQKEIKSTSMEAIDINKWRHNLPKDVDYSRIYKNTNMLTQYIDDESINIICSRLIPLTLVMEKYKISKRIATIIRINLTNNLIKRGIDILKGPHNISKNTKLSESYILGIILAKEFSNVDCKNNICEVFADKISTVIKKYNINFNDKRIWKSIETYYLE